MIHSIQQLDDEDIDLHVETSEHTISILEDQRNDNNICFSDQSTFYICGIVNRHNCRTWAATNPFTTVEAAMNSRKVNVHGVQCRTSKSLVHRMVTLLSSKCRNF